MAQKGSLHREGSGAESTFVGLFQAVHPQMSANIRGLFELSSAIVAQKDLGLFFVLNDFDQMLLAFQFVRKHHGALHSKLFSLFPAHVKISLLFKIS